MDACKLDSFDIPKPDSKSPLLFSIQIAALKGSPTFNGYPLKILAYLLQ
jgi:hypothetical protein